MKQTEATITGKLLKRHYQHNQKCTTQEKLATWDQPKSIHQWVTKEDDEVEIFLVITQKAMLNPLLKHCQRIPIPSLTIKWKCSTKTEKKMSLVFIPTDKTHSITTISIVSISDCCYKGQSHCVTNSKEGASDKLTEVEDIRLAEDILLQKLNLDPSMDDPATGRHFGISSLNEKSLKLHSPI